jgi:hypothetical protein
MNNEVSVSSLLPSTTYFIHVQGEASNPDNTNFCDAWSSISFTTPANSANPVTAVWTGAANTSWTNPDNWQCGIIPGTATEVIINGGLPQYPLINTNRTIRKLTANPGATVTVSPGIVLTITGN